MNLQLENSCGLHRQFSYDIPVNAIIQKLMIIGNYVLRLDRVQDTIADDELNRHIEHIRYDINHVLLTHCQVGHVPSSERRKPALDAALREHFLGLELKKFFTNCPVFIGALLLLLLMKEIIDVIDRDYLYLQWKKTLARINNIPLQFDKAIANFLPALFQKLS